MPDFRGLILEFPSVKGESRVVHLLVPKSKNGLGKKPSMTAIDPSGKYTWSFVVEELMGSVVHEKDPSPKVPKMGLRAIVTCESVIAYTREDDFSLDNYRDPRDVGDFIIVEITVSNNDSPIPIDKTIQTPIWAPPPVRTID